ncbi:hypothetical protein RDI58_016181 [Solanum bulbocastanum]|uniref:Uncharacterized protein n=1 Tax=Solanum bulbocastanum TaxID=147425 RepID=A0AAN8TPS6_SOLBU
MDTGESIVVSEN